MALYPELSSVLQGSPNVVHQGFATINFCPDVTDCTNLFSQYRITEVEYHIINSNYTGVEISQGTGMPLVPDKGTFQCTLGLNMAVSHLLQLLNVSKSKA